MATMKMSIKLKNALAHGNKPEVSDVIMSLSRITGQYFPTDGFLWCIKSYIVSIRVMHVMLCTKLETAGRHELFFYCSPKFFKVISLARKSDVPSKFDSNVVKVFEREVEATKQHLLKSLSGL